MPPLTRWFIKSALVYLVAALFVGVVLAFEPFARSSSAVSGLMPVYFHLLMLGWVAQTIFGVALWMFPRQSRERPRGNEALAVATYVTLNAGLVIRVMAEPMLAVGGGAPWAWMLVAAAVLQWCAGVAFTMNIWGRVRER
jgi:hypothetical protein